MYTCTGAKNRGAKAQSTDRQSSRWRRPCEGTRLYERDRRLRWEDEKMSLRLSAMHVQVVTFFSLKFTKTSSIRDRLLLSSKRSSLSLYRLRDVWALTEKQPVSTSLGVFRHEVAQTALPRKKPKRKDISLDDRSWAWRTRLFKFKSGRKPCVGLRHFFFGFFCRNSFDRDVGQFAAKWLAFLAMLVAWPWLRKWCRKAVNDAFAACVAGYGSHSPEVLQFGPVFEHSARVAGKVSLMQQISHNRPAAD